MTALVMIELSQVLDILNLRIVFQDKQKIMMELTI